MNDNYESSEQNPRNMWLGGSALIILMIILFFAVKGSGTSRSDNNKSANSDSQTEVAAGTVSETYNVASTEASAVTTTETYNLDEQLENAVRSKGFSSGPRRDWKVYKDDFDKDGTRDLIAVIPDEGRVLVVDVTEKRGAQSQICEGEFYQEPQFVQCFDCALLSFSLGFGGSGSVPYTFIFDQGLQKQGSLPGTMAYLGGREFECQTAEYNGSYSDGMYTGRCEYSYPYHLVAKKFEEYPAKKISARDFESGYQNGPGILGTIKDYYHGKVTGIIKRANGIVDINFQVPEDYGISFYYMRAKEFSPGKLRIIQEGGQDLREGNIRLKSK